MFDLPKRQLEMVCDILKKHAPTHEVWAFGSRVKGKARSYSDLDLVLVGEKEIPVRTMNLLTEAFQESELPIRVDVLDWFAISEAFRQVIAQDYVVVQASKDITVRSLPELQSD